MIKNWNITTIPESEIIKRKNRVLENIGDGDAALFFSPAAISYLTGASFIATERPFALLINSDMETTIFAPFLELEHIPRVAVGIDEILTYREYPGETHPMLLLKDILYDMGFRGKKIVADTDGYGRYFGYEGPQISSLCNDIHFEFIPNLISKLQQIKSEYDIYVIKETTKWSNFAHTLLYEYTKPGLNELDVVHKVMHEATRATLFAMGKDFRPSADIRISADFRGQVGENTYYPHALFNNAKFKKGDILGTRAGSGFLGYKSELERCMFIGEPSKEEIKYYNHIITMQDIAFNMIKPGMKCSEVDIELTRYFEDNGLMEYWRHHTGHGLGLDKHEAPFLDSHDHTIMEEGMVLSIEPGIYVKGLGGFRLSDTILVTKDGIEMITYYPRDLESNIIDC